MDSKTTETKTPLASRSKISEISKTCENLNPNLSSPSPGLKKMSNSLRAKSAKVENGDDQGEMEPLNSESCVKRRRDRLLKEARNSGPVYGSGRVAHLVQAFERLLSITKYLDLKAENGSKENKNERMKWALPGLEQPKVSEAPQASSFDLWDNSL